MVLPLAGPSVPPCPAVHCYVARRTPQRGPGKTSGCQVHAARTEALPSQGSDVGLLLECDGVLVDIHMYGHRVAFNRAFAALGLESASWEPKVYHDLLRFGDGSPEALLSTYFNTVGWPLSVRDREKREFVNKIHSLKKEALQRMVEAAALPLRPGAEQLVREALSAGARVGVVGATSSSAEENVVNAALTAMGDDVAEQVQVFTRSGGDASTSSPDDAPAAPSFEQSVAAVTAKAKRAQARNAIKAISSSPSIGASHLGVDSSLMAGGRAAGRIISPTWLAACAALMGTPAAATAFVAATNSTVQAARGAGFAALVVPPARSSRGKYTGAHATFDGFGPGGGLTWARVLRLVGNPRLASHRGSR